MNLLRIQSFLLFLILIIVSGCAKHEKKLYAEPAVMPEITTAYLLEQRIISYEPKFREKIIATLPYEITAFDENYLIYLIARIPDKNSTNTLQTKQPHYYLWLERKASNWRDFTVVRSFDMSPLNIHPHYSAIREGNYYKNYTIDLIFEQMSDIQDKGLTLELINLQDQRSVITIPGFYIKAYLEMIRQSSQ